MLINSSRRCSSMKLVWRLFCLQAFACGETTNKCSLLYLVINASSFWYSSKKGLNRKKCIVSWLSSRTEKGGVMGISFKWRELGMGPRMCLLIVSVGPLGEVSELRSKLSKIRYSDYPMKPLCFPYWREYPTYFLVASTLPNENTVFIFCVLFFIFLSGVLKFLKLIVGKWWSSCAFLCPKYFMVAILVNLSIPNLAQRIEIMVFKRFSGLSKLKFFFL